MTYEIHIGEVFDIDNSRHKPSQVMIISEDQKLLIEQFASTRVDKEMKKVYRLNDVEFKIFPHFKIDPRKAL